LVSVTSESSSAEETSEGLKQIFFVLCCQYCYRTLPVTEDRSQNVENTSKALRSLDREVGAIDASEWQNEDADPGPESSKSSRDEIRIVVGVGSHGASENLSVIFVFLRPRVGENL